jgi:hypothetical protein
MRINLPRRGRIVAGGMLRVGTPLEDYRKEYGIWVKREDLSCPPPGPPFSKTRGVYARILQRPEYIIGVLDTYHSQAGHAVARACQILGKKCLNFYPEYKHEPGPRLPQLRARSLGAEIIGLPAGKSCILFHQARKETEKLGGHMMPNALKLDESIEETSNEVPSIRFNQVIIPASSGTIAAGVIRGLGVGPRYIVHLGYSRPHGEVLKYLEQKSKVRGADIQIIDEGYSYKDKAKDGPTPPWPCNPYYDLKAFRWWILNGFETNADNLFWNIG